MHDITIIIPHKPYKASQYAVPSILMLCVLCTMCLRTHTEEIISASLGFSLRSGQILMTYYMNWMARLQAGHPRVQNPAGTRNSCLFQNIETGSGAHTAFFLVDTEGTCPGGKAAPSGMKFNEWSCTFMPSTCHNGVHRDYFTFCIVSLEAT